jgi:hypothetical protein
VRSDEETSRHQSAGHCASSPWWTWLTTSWVRPGVAERRAGELGLQERRPGGQGRARRVPCEREGVLVGRLTVMITIAALEGCLVPLEGPR